MTTIGEGAFANCRSLDSVYYCGTQAQWQRVSIEDDNDPLYEANIYFEGSYHSVSVSNNLANGRAVASPSYACAGKEVVVTGLPESGYYTETVIVDGNPIVGRKFMMPDHDVTVEVIFKVIEQAPVGETANVDDQKYTISNNAMDGTGTVTFNGVSKQAAAVVIPATVEIKGITYKVTSIAAKAFYGDKVLARVTIGSNVSSIGNYAFYGCNKLTTVSGGARVKTIGSYAYAKCPKLSSFTITSAVLAKIGQKAFYKDSKLKTINIRNTVSLTKSGVKKSLKGSSVKTVKVKKSKVKKYKKFFKKSNSGRKVTVKK